MLRLSARGAGWLLLLARRTIESTLLGRQEKVPLEKVPAELTTQRAGVFVTLTRRRQLRACWGTLEPQRLHLAEEVIASAEGVCYRDDRFPPLHISELSQIRVAVSVVADSPRLVSAHQIHPVKHGVLVRSGGLSAVVLPHEGRTVSRMLALARQKAGISPNSSLEVYAFRVYTVSEQGA